MMGSMTISDPAMSRFHSVLLYCWKALSPRARYTSHAVEVDQADEVIQVRERQRCSL